MTCGEVCPAVAGDNEAVEKPGRFVGPGVAADVAVLIVTYQSGADVSRLLASLRAEGAGLRLRVVVADNASSDGTPDLVRTQDDVVLRETGGNLGYAAGVNVATRAAGEAGALLVLNPDLVVEPGCIASLLRRRQLSGAGVVVPRILDDRSATYPSLRREPTLGRAVGDALLGSRLAGRPGFLSETVGRKSEYERPHPVDWATGAALLIATDVARKVGDWDERFFLYSEETDFLRRVREAGETVWYEPEAVVRHAQGGSGESVALDCLLAVNRVRYAAKHHGAVYTELFRGVVVLNALLRAWQPSHRASLRTLLVRSRWEALPHACRHAPPERVCRISGSVIIPAHNEAAVLGRTLQQLAALLASPGLDLIVAANGCTDSTTEIAARVAGVRVLDLTESSKTAALNAGDLATDHWPRIYLDADIDIPIAAVCDTLDALAHPGALAARPPYAWDLDGADPLVQAYYRARARIPSAHVALWGAGVYALSREGHARFGVFPAVVADDLFVDQQYAPQEKQIVGTDPVRVRVPRSTRDLLKVLRRQARGSNEMHAGTGRTTLREVLGSIRGPTSLFDAVVYVCFALASRRSNAPTRHWERDESSRMILAEQERAA